MPIFDWATIYYSNDKDNFSAKFSRKFYKEIFKETLMVWKNFKYFKQCSMVVFLKGWTILYKSID